MNFETLDELKNFLRRDVGQKSFSPVRFINVETRAAWLELKNFLGTLTAATIFLSDYCAADTFPNVRKLRDDLRREMRNVCVVPLAEIFRLNPERAAEELNLFTNLRAGEPSTLRIYFPTYRLKNFFLSLKISDPRRENSILLFESAAAENFSLTIIQKSMPLKISGECVDGLKQYLKSREKSPSPSLILFTANAIYLQDKKFFDDVQVIANAFDLLRHRHALPAEFKKSFGREEDWQRLAELVAANRNFERAFCREFNVDGFSLRAFKNFGGLEKFRRWLLWLRCKLQGASYVGRCARESSSPEEFVEQIYESIFSGEEKFLEERREILSLMKSLPPEKFLARIRQADKKFALKILTENSHGERLMIFETLRRFRFNELSAAREILRRTFPALAKYLSEGEGIFSEAQAEYFRRYRWLKVTNQLTEEFNRRVTELARAAGENIYALKSRNEIVGEEYSEAAAIFFVDGLGAEYMNFFAAEFSSLGENFSVRYQIGRCNLPSVTELNKDFLQGRNVAAEILDLDTLKHESRTYPENILGELEILSTLKEKILRALDIREKIILCADHGTSRLAVLARQDKFDNAIPADGRKVFKSGRFAEVLSDGEKNFPTALEHDGKIIFADYSRFVQKGGTGSEVHGGASLEEILVPVITIERRKKISPPPVPKIKRGIVANKNFDI